MSEDARFEDATEAPLRLLAMDADDLAVISALVQDAVLPAAEMRWQPRARRFVMLLNRFRWEDHDRALTRGRPVERVQALLVVEDVLRVVSQGLVPGDADLVLSLLSLSFQPGEDGSGRLLVTLAGDGAIMLDVECLSVSLCDVSRPYRAPSGKVPRHD